MCIWSLNSCGEQAIFKLDIKKKSGLSLNPDIHHSKVFSSGILYSCLCKCIFVSCILVFTYTLVYICILVFCINFYACILVFSIIVYIFMYSVYIRSISPTILCSCLRMNLGIMYSWLHMNLGILNSWLHMNLGILNSWLHSILVLGIP